MENQISEKYFPVDIFCNGRAWPTASALRHLLFFRREEMVRAGAIVCVGRRVLVDPVRFDAWLSKQSLATAGAA